MAEEKKKAEAASPASPAEQPAPEMSLTLKWDDSKMVTNYANVVNASSTREEVSVFFGSNKTWNVAADKELHIQLTNRIVLNPYAAKRLVVLLSKIIKEYESRFGRLPLEGEAKK